MQLDLLVFEGNGSTSYPKCIYQQRPSTSGLNESPGGGGVWGVVTGQNTPVSIQRTSMVWARVKEAIYVRREKPSLNRGGGLQHKLSSALHRCSQEDPPEVKTFLWHQHSVTGQWTLAGLHQSAWRCVLDKMWNRCLQKQVNPVAKI